MRAVASAVARAALGAAALAVLLAGCRTAPLLPRSSGPGADAPWPEQRAALEKLDRYSLDRAGSRSRPTGRDFPASFDTSSSRSAPTWRSTGPWASAVCVWFSTVMSSSITTSRGEKLDGAAARAELEQRLGFACRWPSCAGGCWAFRRRVRPAVDADAGSGEIRGFTQDGWHVSIDARAPALGLRVAAAAHRDARGRAHEAAGRALAAVSSTADVVRVWSAPAKLNLMLHVVGRRPDGYHELQTVFQLVDLATGSTSRSGTDGVISRPQGPAGCGGSR